MARTGGLKTYQRGEHMEALLNTEREIAALKGRLSKLLPQRAYANLLTRLEGLAYPSQRLDYLIQAADWLRIYSEIVEEADHIIQIAPNLASITGQGQEHQDVPLHWEVMAHVALVQGWTRIGRDVLQKSKSTRRV